MDDLYFKIFLNKIDRSKLDKDQLEILNLNLKKHMRIFLLLLLVMPYVYFVITNFYADQIDLVISSLFGVLFISGAAWYAISFGAVPVKFMDFAVHITAYLFTSLAVSMAAVLVAASIAVPLLSPILFIAFYSLYAASVKFDVVDALKLGIDETVFQHAKVGRIYFQRELKKQKKTERDPDI